MKSVDNAINAICDWIQKELKSENIAKNSVLPEMTTALAELLKAEKGLQTIEVSLEPKEISTELLMQDIKEKLEESIQDCCY